MGVLWRGNVLSEEGIMRGLTMGIPKAGSAFDFMNEKRKVLNFSWRI